MISDVSSKGNSQGKPRGGNKSSNVYLIGTGIQKSLSPSIHNALFRRFKIDAIYSLIDVHEAEFEATILGILEFRNMLGFNITAPFKERMLPYLSKIDGVASAVGAVNTVKIGEKQVISGYNTDVDGVQVTLSELGLLSRCKKERLGRPHRYYPGSGWSCESLHLCPSEQRIWLDHDSQQVN